MTAAAEHRPRLAETDALRAIATVGVILIHDSAWGPASPYAAVGLIARFSVPAFTLLTGLLLAYQYTGRATGLDFARRRLSRSILPWLVWAPLYVVFDMLVPHTIERSSPAGVHFLLGGAGHLWYLLLVPQLYVIFMLWPRRHPWLLAACALALQTALCVLRTFGPIPDGAQTLLLNYGFLLFPLWIGYFAVGVAAGRSWHPVPEHLRLPVAAAAAVATALTGYALLNITFAGARWASFLQGTGAFLNPLLPAFVGSVAVLVLASYPLVQRASRTVHAAVLQLSELSLGIYIVHPIALWYVGRLLFDRLVGPQPGSLVTFTVLTFAVLVLAALGSRILGLTPLAFTIGMRQRPLQGNVAVLALRARDALLLRHPQRVDQR